MTSTTAAPLLSPFDGRDVLRSTIAITNAGDGLSDAMKVDPKEWHHGETVIVVLECEVTKIGHVPFDGKDLDGPLSRVHTFKAGTATIVEGDVLGAIKESLTQQALKVAEAKEAEKGISRLDFGGEADPEVLSAQHDLQEHYEGPVDGCPKCITDQGDDDGAAGTEPRTDDDEDDEATVLRRNHMQGSHEDEPMPGCPMCDQAAVANLMGNTP